ncbi:MAG: hypothetical protein QXW47_10025 [Candidatus Jordarchaeales archaeon]
MAIQNLDCLFREFNRAFGEFLSIELVSQDHISDVAKANSLGLHSFLQAVLLTAGYRCCYIVIPEYKVRLKKPIDK